MREKGIKSDKAEKSVRSDIFCRCNLTASTYRGCFIVLFFSTVKTVFKVFFLNLTRTFHNRNGESLLCLFLTLPLLSCIPLQIYPAMDMDSASTVVLQALTQATSQDTAVLKPAEEQLRQWETQPGFYSVLLVREMIK